MKKILKYISLLAGVAFLTAACSQSDIDGNASEEMGTLRLSVNIGGSRADAYNALDRSIMRVYKIENGEEKLIRKYQPATEAPGDFYLVAGSYRIKVEAGDQSQVEISRLRKLRVISTWWQGPTVSKWKQGTRARRPSPTRVITANWTSISNPNRPSSKR